MDRQKFNYNNRILLIMVGTFIIGSILLFSLVPKVKSTGSDALFNFLGSWPMALLVILPLLGVIIYCIYTAIKNVKLIAKLLNAKTSFPLLTIFFYKSITGDYKGRIIMFRRVFSGSRKFDFVIKPRLLNKIKIPFYSYRIEITDNAVLGDVLENGEIWYIPKPFNSAGWQKGNIFIKHKEQDFIDIFEELTRAAEIVETQPVETFIKGK